MVSLDKTASRHPKQLTIEQIAGWIRCYRNTTGTWPKKHWDALPKDFQEKLLGLGFDPNPQASQWNEKFRELKVYAAIHGNCDVPARHASNPSLGNWVHNQRTKWDSLPEDRRKKLLDIGFTPDLLAAAWNTKFEELKAYAADHNGSCNVPQRYEPNPSLGAWVSKQRATWDSLPEARRKKLLDIGFNPKLRDDPDTVWNTRFEELKAYAVAHKGSCDVPQGYKPNLALGAWVSNQRRRWDSLPEDRREKLLDLGFNPKLRGTTPNLRQQSADRAHTQYDTLSNIPETPKASVAIPQPTTATYKAAQLADRLRDTETAQRSPRPRM